MKTPAARKLPSGMWFCRVRVNGQDVGITRATEKEAVAEAMAVKAGLKRPVQSTQKTLGAAIDDYISSKENVLSPATVTGYCQIRKHRFKSLMGMNVSAITPERLQRAVNEESKTISPKYLKNALSLIRSAIKAETGSAPEATRPRVIPPDLAFLDSEQLPKFLSAAKGHKGEIAALLALTSLRRSEILDMKWSDVDLKKGVVHVRGAAVVGNNGLVRRDENKSAAGRRDIPFIYPQLRAAIEAADKTQSEYIISTRENNLINWVHSICRAAGIPEVSLHDLRRTFATTMYRYGVPERLVMKWGGWSSIDVVHKIYIKLDKSFETEQARRVLEQFGNENGNGN